MKQSTSGKPIQNSPLQVRIPILLSIALAGGILIGTTFVGGNPDSTDAVRGYNKFREVLMQIDNNYVDSVNTDELVDYSIAKMLEKLDPHTSYLNAEEAIAARAQLESGFDGIGVEFNIFNDTVYVVTPLQGGPSEEIGIRSGDRLLKANEEALSGPGITNTRVFKLLRGQRGTKVKLEVGRSGMEKPLVFDVTRNRIPTYSVDASYMIDKETGYIKVTRFSESTYDEFKKALSDLKQKGLNKLILDLRGNPGGYMERAVNMADEFISGNKLLVYTHGKKKRFDKESRAQITGMFEEGPLIVLVDEGSASASEIVAGALQDHDRGLIIGRRTFGKGLVQMPQQLKDGSELRLTISRYYTPSGRSIQKPYEMGKGEDYEKDLTQRFDKGELFNADSIHLDKKLKYNTEGGREVYGGGGIMPDIFVASDSSGNSKYLYELHARNVLREYAMRYASANEEKMSRQSFQQFNEGFEVQEKMLAELKKEATRAGVPYNEKEFLRSRRRIQLEIKALLGRYIWGKQRKDGLSNEIYQVLNPSDNVYLEALRQFANAEALEKGKFSSMILHKK